MSPKLKSLLARITLAVGVTFVASYVARQAPHDQAIVLRLHDRDWSHIEGFVTRQGDDEPTAGFSRDFPAGTQAPPSVRHAFSAPNGTYIVVITLRRNAAIPEEAGAVAPAARAETGAAAPAPRVPRDRSPIPTETSFQRQVSLAGGEIIVSPD